MTTFAVELKRLREKASISQSKLAERSGFDHSYVSRLESGARMPTRDCVDRLAEAMRLEPTGHDKLLTAAGFVPTDVGSLIGDEPECGDLLGYLTDPGVPDGQRQAVRAAVRSLLVAVMGG